MHKLATVAACCRLQAASCNLQFAGCKLQAAVYRLQDAGCRLQATGYKLQAAGCGVNKFDEGRSKPGGLKVGIT